MCPNTDDDAEEDAPVLILCGEGDLYPEVSENGTADIDAVAPDLSEGQRQQLRDLMEETPSVFQSKPGRTTIVQHTIHTGNAAPIRQRPYRIPYHITSAPVLQVTDPAKPYILQTDASDRGLRAILSRHDQLGEEHPVAFASRKLLPWETKYSTFEKECLAIV